MNNVEEVVLSYEREILEDSGRRRNVSIERGGLVSEQKTRIYRGATNVVRAVGKRMGIHLNPPKTGVKSQELKYVLCVDPFFVFVRL